MELIKSKIYLKNFSVDESDTDGIDFKFSECKINRFNLFIGDNGQGKTRLLNTLQFIKQLLKDERKRISTNFSAQFYFCFNDKPDETNIFYEIKILPSNEGNIYAEKIKKNDKVLLSTEDKKLYDEKNEKFLENFFVPKNIPVIASIIDDSFETIGLIRDFFNRMVFLNDNKVSQFVFNDQNALIADSTGANLVSVVFNWSTKYPRVYEELVSDFKACFPFVDDFLFKQIPIVPNGRIDSVLHMHEKDIKKDIPIFSWAAGMTRLFCILCLPKIIFESEKKYYYPSLICIDEVEEGLDFKSVKYITQYLQDYSQNMQVLFTSHSPNIIEFIHPKYWKIVRRKGPIIKITSLEEDNLNEDLEFFRQKYWDFYTKHISNSDLYIPK